MFFSITSNKLRENLTTNPKLAPNYVYAYHCVWHLTFFNVQKRVLLNWSVNSPHYYNTPNGQRVLLTTCDGTRFSVSNLRAPRYYYTYFSHKKVTTRPLRYANCRLHINNSQHILVLNRIPMRIYCHFYICFPTHSSRYYILNKHSQFFNDLLCV